MSRFGVVDKGLLNGYSTYLLLSGFFAGLAVSSGLHGYYGVAVIWGAFAALGWRYIKKTYPNIEEMQDDFIEHQDEYMRREYRGRSDTQ